MARDIGIIENPEAHHAWPLIVEMLEPARKLDPERNELIRDCELCWVVVEGNHLMAACTTRLTEDDEAEIILCGGIRADLWARDLSEIICQWARDEGAEKVLITGRRGWSRLLDWVETGREGSFVRLERDLKNV